jgi:hypothetical protein
MWIAAYQGTQALSVTAEDAAMLFSPRTNPARSMGSNSTASLTLSGNLHFKPMRHDGSTYIGEPLHCLSSVPMTSGVLRLSTFGRPTVLTFRGLRRSILATVSLRHSSIDLHCLSEREVRWPLELPPVMVGKPPSNAVACRRGGELWRYTSTCPSKWLQSSLSLKVRFTQPFELNDPFDFRPILDFVGTANDVRGVVEADL